ncbi:hypothetical protein [Streptomyces sp. NPDC058644]|uniref:hypothetical protein n=1 Tax=unclassified Streptomyces TaxID=2593676 RepID=UPI003667C781
MTSDSDFPRQDGTTPELPRIVPPVQIPFPKGRAEEGRAEDPDHCDAVIEDMLFPIVQEHLLEEPGFDELPYVDYDRHLAEVLRRSAGQRARREETQALEEAFAAPAAESEIPKQQPSDRLIITLDSTKYPDPAPFERTGGRSRQSRNANTVPGTGRWRRTVRVGLSLGCVLVAVAALVFFTAPGGIFPVAALVVASMWFGVAFRRAMASIRATARTARAGRYLYDEQSRNARSSQLMHARLLREIRERSRTRRTVRIVTGESNVKKRP